METLIVEIPDWARDKSIKVFAGGEWILLRTSPRIDARGNRHGERVTYRKTARCSMCGRCCIIERLDSAPFGVKKMNMHGKEETVCEFLEEEQWDFNGEVRKVFVCKQRGPRVPWGCLGAHARKPYPGCTVEWTEEVERGRV